MQEDSKLKITEEFTTQDVLKIIAVLSALVIGLLLFYGGIKVWRATYNGKAQKIAMEYEGRAILARAEYSKRARVEAARAEKEAAQLTADAIKIVGQAAQDFPEYRQQEFFLALGDALKDGKIQQVIYLPTEAGLPITEAAKR